MCTTMSKLDLSVMSKFLHYYYIILILVYLKVAMLVLGFEHIASF